jgi:hypothetical protein
MEANDLPTGDGPLTWRSSSHSGADNADCVQTADGIPGLTPVRDSKRPDRVLTFPPTAWHRFTTALKDGHLPG